MGCPASSTGLWGFGPPTLYGWGHSHFWWGNGASYAPIWGSIPVWVGGGSGLPRILAHSVFGGGMVWTLPPPTWAVGDPPSWSHTFASGRPSERPFWDGDGGGGIAEMFNKNPRAGNSRFPGNGREKFEPLEFLSYRSFPWVGKFPATGNSRILKAITFSSDVPIEF